MVHEDTNEYWVAYFTTIITLAVSVLQSGREVEAELILTTALKRFKESAACDVETVYEISKVLQKGVP